MLSCCLVTFCLHNIRYHDYDIKWNIDNHTQRDIKSIQSCWLATLVIAMPCIHPSELLGSKYIFTVIYLLSLLQDHWKSRVVMMPALSSIAVLRLSVLMTTYCYLSHDKIVSDAESPIIICIRRKEASLLYCRRQCDLISLCMFSAPFPPGCKMVTYAGAQQTGRKIIIKKIGTYSITVTSWWTRWHLKSPACRLFTQPSVHAQIKENIKAPRHVTL